MGSTLIVGGSTNEQLEFRDRHQEANRFLGSISYRNNYTFASQLLEPENLRQFREVWVYDSLQPSKYKSHIIDKGDEEFTTGNIFT